MKTILVLYATRNGHTRRIAEQLAAWIVARGNCAETLNAAHIPAGFSLDAYAGAMIAASVHRGRHQREMVDFVKSHVRELDRIPTAFLSVSLSQAGAEDEAAPPEKRAQAAADVARMIDGFLAETSWRPTRIEAVAGALLYTKYNFLLRWVMKRISRQAGGTTDTSRDHEYTNWAALDQLADEFVTSINPCLNPSMSSESTAAAVKGYAS